MQRRLARLVLLGLVGAFTMQHIGQAEPIEGIDVQGSPAFVQRTREAITLLRRTAQFELIQRRMKIIREAERSGMRAYDALPTYEVGAATWTHSAMWYAGTMAHDAYHAQLYHEATRQNQGREPDPDAWTGVEAERQCLTFQKDVLQDIGADADLIHYVSQLMNHPTYHGNPKSWEDYETRQW